MIITNQSKIQYSYTLPDGNVITETRDSNIVTTEVMTYAFTKVKTSNKTFLKEGETATHTVTLTNNSQQNISNIFFTDTLTSGASHVAGSVVVNGTSQPTYDLVAGFNVGDLNVGANTVVSYLVQANNPATAISATDFATVNYTASGRSLTENSNPITLALVEDGLTNVKTVDKAVAVQGETLHYTSVIDNTGSLPKTNLIFSDTIPTGTTFVPNSVKINGVQQVGFEPSIGFGLPDLNPGEQVTVEFDVTVN